MAVKDLRINEQIRLSPVRLIGADGEQVGIVPIEEAMSAAEQASLDLVEIVPNAEPPVCRVMDYGKHKYEQDQKQKEARRKQAQITNKEIKMRPNIDDHDYQVKMRSIQRFIDEGDKAEDMQKVAQHLRRKRLKDMGVEVDKGDAE